MTQVGSSDSVLPDAESLLLTRFAFARETAMFVAVGLRDRLARGEGGIDPRVQFPKAAFGLVFFEPRDDAVEMGAPCERIGEADLRRAIRLLQTHDDLDGVAIVAERRVDVARRDERFGRREQRRIDLAKALVAKRLGRNAWAEFGDERRFLDERREDLSLDRGRFGRGGQMTRHRSGGRRGPDATAETGRAADARCEARSEILRVRDEAIPTQIVDREPERARDVDALLIPLDARQGRDEFFRFGSCLRCGETIREDARDLAIELELNPR